MIKAYFFDFMNTLGNADKHVSYIITKKEFHDLLTKKLEDVELSEEYKAMVYSILSEVNFSLYGDSQDVVSRLKKEGYKLAIVSDMYNPLRMRKQLSKFVNYFDVISLSSEVGFRKPDPRIFSNTLTKLNGLNGNNISFKEVMFIGDNYEKDIIPAQRLGMQARLIDRTKQTLSDVI